MEDGFTTQTRTGKVFNLTSRQGLLGYDFHNDWVHSYPGERQTTFSYRSNLDPNDVDLRASVYTDATAKPSDTGHSFWTQRNRYAPVAPYGDYYLIARSGGGWYRGPVVMYPPNPAIPYYTGAALEAMTPTADNTLKDYGQRAINQLAPTVPAAQATRALGELAIAAPELPFMGWPHTDDLSQYVGDQWLNAAFGIIPTVQDAKAIIQSLKNRSRMIAQLMRDSDRVVRRSFRFPTINTVETEEIETNYFDFLTPTGGYSTTKPHVRGVAQDFYSRSSYPFPPAKESEPIVLTRTVTQTQDIWFKGAFTYHIPKDDGLLNELSRLEAQANVLLGTRFTPSTFWELTPWSWLVDWNWKIGQAIKSADVLSTYGLVIEYGYLMCHTKRLETVVSPRIEMVNGSGSVWVKPTGYMLRSERKERIRADPYGFAVAPVNYTDSQWAILGALTLARGGGRAGQQG
jgi:hypothetical protein